MIKNKIKRIEVVSMSKMFHADCRKATGSLSYFLNTLAFRKEKKEIVVAKNISFSVESNEILGVIGKNGAGKSSLLRIIAGIYQPDAGNIHINGKVIYINGYGQGSSSRLTMRENIFLTGSVLGLSQKQIRKKFNDIVAFSGLEEYIDMKLYQFSSGMISRLNFSVTIHCVKHHDPDILLIDEVFSAGGDASFKEKATKKMEDLIKGGAAVILVSHDFEIMKKYCHKVMWLDKGKIREVGSTEEVVSKYEKNRYGKK